LVEEMARREDRVLIRLSPQRTVYSPRTPQCRRRR